MQRNRSIVLVFASLFLTLILIGCGSNGAGPIAIAGSLPATGTVGVAYSGSLGVSYGTAPYTWTFSNLPPGISSSATTGTNITLAGTPTAAGTYDISVTVTDSKSATATYTVAVVVSQTLTITPTTLGNLVSGTAATPVTLTIAPATTGPYTWTVSSGALPAGLVLNNGTATSATTITSTTTTITITGTPTATGTYSLTLSVADSASPTGTGSQAFSGTINGVVSAACATAPGTLGNESALTVPFAYLLKGADSTQNPAYWAGSFTPNGSGGITAADADFLSASTGYASLKVNLAASSYAYGNDGRGCLYLVFTGENLPPAERKAKTPDIATLRSFKRARTSARPEVAPAGPASVTFSFSLSLGNQTGRIQEYDYVTSQLAGAGQMHQQTTADFSLTNLASNFAFGLDGWYSDNSGYSRTAIAGSLAQSAGALSSGTADENVGGTASGALTGGSGTLNSTVSSTTGRGNGTYTIPNGNNTLTFDFAFYIVNNSDLYILSTDQPVIPSFLLAGRALQSAATSVAPNGYYISAVSGVDPNNGENVVSIGTLQLATSGNVTSATIYTNDAGTYAKNTYSNATYTFDATTGRITAFTGDTSQSPVAYLTSTATEDDIAAFVVGTGATVTSGFVALQGTATPALSDSSVSGAYSFGTAEDISGKAGSQTGTFVFDGKGGYTGTVDTVISGEPSPTPSQSFTGTISINADGSGNFDNNNKVLVTNGPLIVAIDATNVSEPQIYVLVQQTSTK